MRSSKLLPVWLILGCTGAIEPASSPSDEGGAPAREPGARTVPGPGGAGESKPPPSGAACAAAGSLFGRPLARLSSEELDNAFEDLLVDKTRPVPEGGLYESTFGDFKFGLAPLNRDAVESYVSVLDDVTSRAVARDRRKQWMSCDPAVNGCLGDWLKGFLPRALRSSVADQEIQQLAALYESEKAELGPDEALRAVLKAVFLAPRFLFHMESGPVDGGARGNHVVKLTAHELAARLSFFLWRSVPDGKLMEAAERGGLADRGALAAEVGRMAADPRARRSLKSFVEQWLGTEALTGLTALKKETATFFTEAVLGQGGVKELLTASYSYLDAESARLYGESGVGRVEFKNSPRSGLLTQGIVLSAFSGASDRNVIFRGKLVREKMMCTDFPPAPDNATSMKVDRLSFPSCQGCHQLLDPVGRGFEKYTATGVYRERDAAGQPIAAKGELVDKKVAFDGAQELGRYLAASEDVHACMGKTMFTYALRQGMDDCTSERLAKLSASGGSLLSLIKEIVLSDAFSTRALNAATKQ